MKQTLKLPLIIFAVSLFMAASALAEKPGLINKPFSIPGVYKKIAKTFYKTEDILKNKRKKQNKEEEKEELITFLV